MSFEWQPDPYPGLPLDGHMVDAGKEAHTKIYSEEQGKREEGTGMDLWIPGACFSRQTTVQLYGGGRVRKPGRRGLRKESIL